MKAPQRWWIKEKHNPQLGVYYVCEGLLSEAEAKRRKRTAYGHNVMHPFAVEEEYRARIDQLKRYGNSVQE